MHLKFSLVILISLIFLSCKNDQVVKAAEDQVIFDKVMAIHDDVMPKMNEIHRLKKELRAEIDSTQEDELRLITEQLVLLNDADESMMEWMHDLDLPEDKAAKIEYLNGQLPLIENVRDKMLSSINSATVLLKELDN